MTTLPKEHSFYDGGKEVGSGDGRYGSGTGERRQRRKTEDGGSN